MANDKDTIYVDIDDEITGIIDKLRASDGKVVALVLPKRAAVLQSIVNMKLLKRSSDTAKKNLVLITSEAGLMPLAGAAGVHVARSLTSKPEIPSAPPGIDDAEEMVSESETDAESAVDPNAPVGELAGAKPPLGDQGVETLVLDDEDLPPEDGAPEKPVAKTFEPPAKKNKKLKIPNFERFRLLLALGVLVLILLIAGAVFAANALPKATITIKTDATNIDANLNLSLSTTAKTVDPAGGTVPAKLEQLQKTYTQQVPTTGQKNTGAKAQGTVTMDAGACSGNVPSDIAAGTGLSSSNQTYITQDDVSFAPSVSHGKCVFQGVNSSGQPSIPVTAQNGGASYNVSGAPFTVSGRLDVMASGSVTGGTDNIVQSVNQNDINTAKSKISTNDNSAKQALDTQAKADGYYPIDATFSTGTPVVTNSVSVGDVATTVTVTEAVTYTLFGVHQADLQALIDGNVKTQIDTSKQSILDDGVSQAVFNVDNMTATGATMSMSAKAVVGPDLSTDSIKSSVAGQKAGAIKSQLSSNPDVTSVDVKFSPFWVSTAPKKTDRIIVNIAKPTTTKSSGSNGTGH